MNLISLKTELRQELKLTPQLLQSMEVLQMNSQELLDYLGKLSEENPTLELSEASELRSAYAELRQKASWLDAGTFGTSFAHEEDGPPEPGSTDKELDTLSAFLCDQLERKRLPKPMLALCKYMAELVDEDGYLQFQLPWSFSVSYGISMRENTSAKIREKRMRYPYKLTHTLNFSGNLQISAGWNISFSSGYDFNYHRLSMTTASLSRDLHCFSMSASVVLSPYRSYNFTFSANAGALADVLRWKKQSSYSSNIEWY